MGEEELLKWAVLNGITDASGSTTSHIVHSLIIATFPESGGRGLAAARDLKEGELILVVPESSLLNVGSFKGDEHISRILKTFSHLSDFQLLVTILLREVARGESSKWFVYLQTLPRSYHTFSQFQPFEIQALQVEDAVSSAEYAAAEAHKQWMQAKPFLEDLGLKGRFVTWRAWQWAHATVSSRTLHVPWSNAGTLCPVGDLFNYAPPGAYQTEAIQKTSCCSISDVHAEDISPLEQNLSPHEVCELDACDTGGNLYFTDRLTDGGFDTNLNSYCFYARENYKKGDEVLLCYGLYTNLELLEHYGFLLPFNPNDKVYLGLNKFHGFACDKPQHGSMHIEVDGRPSFQLLAALRLCFASKAVRQQKGHLALCGQQLSIENDVLVYQRLKERCLALLHEFPSTVHMDSVLEHILSLCGTFDGLIGLLELCGDIKSLSAESQKLLVGSVCGWTALHPQEKEFILHELHSFSQHESRGSGKSASIEDLGLKMERWWLSIRWRFCHKRILYRCVNHCARQLLLLEGSSK